MQEKSTLPKIALGVTLCVLIGAFGLIWIAPGFRDWFPGLIKPAWAPGGTSFGAMWLVVFGLMGVSAGAVWSKIGRSAREKRALWWFGGQIALALAWSALFFQVREPSWAYGVAILLWLSVAATLWLFSKISALAGWFLLPFFAFATFTSSLNFAVLSLNYLKPAVEQMDKDPRNGPPTVKQPGASLR